MYRGPPMQRGPPRPYAGGYGGGYGVYRGPPRGAYGQPYQAPVIPVARHPWLDLMGLTNKFSFSQVNRHLAEVCQRNPRRQVQPDLLEMKCHYAPKSKQELGIPLDTHVTFNCKGTGTCKAPEPAETKAHDNTRYFVRVMLFGGLAPEDEKLKGKMHMSKRMNFLLVKKEHGSVLPIGAEWSAALDGATPNDAAFKKTAIRAAKDLTGIDLSVCKHWLKFVDYSYTRAEGKSVTVFFLPNVWDHFPEGIEPATQVKEVTKEVEEEVEEEEEDPEDPEKKKTVKKKVKSMKTSEVPEYKPYEMSLFNLLEFDCNRPQADEIVELCLFADSFNEMLQRDYGFQVLEILKKKSVENEENDKKRKREEEEAAEKKAKTEGGEEKTEEKKDEKKEGEAKPKVKLQHTIHPEILLPFQYFDKQPHTGAISGNLRREVLEGMLHQLGELTKAQVDDLLLKGAGLKPRAGPYNSPPSLLYYVKLATTTVEVPVEEEEKKEDEEMKEEGAAAEAKGDEAADEDEGAAKEGEDGAMTEASLNKLLLKDLRTMCTEKGLNATGKKAELIERLLKGE